MESKKGKDKMKILINIDKEEYKFLYQAIEKLEDENVLTDFSIQIIEH
tara:strand:- start:126 stop:269 length:144 start_codon:yes stop_codon:yes gene_type:complete